jgi:hypothetical protein
MNEMNMSDFSEKLIRNLSLFVLILVLMLIFESDLSGQCPMCKISAESNMRDGGSAGKGLNAGILYMFVLPYLIIGTLGYLWFKNRKQYDNEP